VAVGLGAATAAAQPPRPGPGGPGAGPVGLAGLPPRWVDPSRRPVHGFRAGCTRSIATRSSTCSTSWRFQPSQRWTPFATS